MNGIVLDADCGAVGGGEEEPGNEFEAVRIVSP